MPPPTVDLRTLVNLEAQLQHDARLEPAGLVRRDAAIGQRLLAEGSLLAEGGLPADGLTAETARQRLGDRQFRAHLAEQWLDRVDDPSARTAAGEEPIGTGPRPGTRLQKGLDALGWALPLGGLVLGVGGANAVLAYDGKTPVNVLGFLGGFVGLQIVLLLIMLALLLTKRAGSGGLYRVVGWLSRTRVVDSLVGDSAKTLGHTVEDLRRLRASFADAERWRLFELAQRFGVAFNVGALAAVLYLVTFSDLAFCWSTTLEVQPKSMHELVRGLAAPWAWFAESAVPDQDVVMASRWVRLQKAFAGDWSLEDATTQSQRWWLFLVAALVTYGLLPRLLAWFGGRTAARRAVARATLDHGAFRQLFDRLIPPSIGFASPDPDAVGSDAPAVPNHARPADAMREDPARWLAWGRLAECADRVHSGIQRIPLTSTAPLAVGGTDLEDDLRVLDALRSERPARVVIALEAGQQPTKELMDFLSDVREALTDSTPVLLVLVVERNDSFEDADPDEREVWRRAIGARDDRYTWLETAS